MLEEKKYQQTGKIKRGAKTSTFESHWSGPEPMPTGKDRPGHFTKDVEPSKQ
jgi:hypothetical protein